MFMLSTLLADTVFGTIEPPKGVKEYNAGVSGDGGIGVFVFMRYGIQLFMAFCGLYVLYNLLMAGYTFISSQGEAKAYTTVRDQIVASAIGMVLIVGSYTATALISYVFFGRADYILNPVINGPLTPPTN
jgi:hypothetical protein